LERYTGGIDMQPVLEGVEVFGDSEETAANLNYKGAFGLLALSQRGKDAMGK
jgi:hypothetical protein